MGRVTIKVVQKYEARSDGKRNVRLRITADRISRYVATNIDVAASSFNPKAKRENLNWIRPAHPNSAVYNEMLSKLWDRAQIALDVAGENGTADQVRALIDAEELPGTEPTTAELPGFLAYTDSFIVRRGESATTDTYMGARSAFGKYLATLGHRDISFDKLTVLFLKNWRQWILSQHSNNTAWLYHSRLKTMYFQAIEDVPGLTSVPTVVSDPFRRVKIPKQKTAKVRLYEDEIQCLASADLPWGKARRRARDIALMMYYAHGMRVGDALRLRLSNYVIIPVVNKDGKTTEEHRLIYTMGKTGKHKNVLLPAVCIALLAPYREACEKPTDTLFPYLRKSIDAGYSAYHLREKVKSKVVLIRDSLINLATDLGIKKALSAHVFRHSFADLARRSKMDVTQIQKALGHDQISTTQGYMDELDQLSVDEVQELFK